MAHSKKKKNKYQIGAEYLMEMIEQSSKEACEMIDQKCFEMLRAHGYEINDAKNPKQLKEMLEKDGFGVRFKYATEEETGDIYLWWELWKYDNKGKAIEQVDKTIELKIKVNNKIEEIGGKDNV